MTREPLPRHLVGFITSRVGIVSIIVTYLNGFGILSVILVAMMYWHFSFARRMALPPRSQAALASLDGGAEETLPHALRPLAADLRVLIASFESLHTMGIGEDVLINVDGEVYVSAMQSAELDLWQWVSTMDSLEAQAQAEALDRGASLDTLRSLLAKHVSPGSMTQAAGLE